MYFLGKTALPGPHVFESGIPSGMIFWASMSWPVILDCNYQIQKH